MSQQAVTITQSSEPINTSSVNTNPVNTSDLVAHIATQTQAINGSMRRQTGDIALIRTRLEDLSSLEAALSEGSSNQVTRQDFNKAINYLYNEIVKQSSINQQFLVTELRLVKLHLESINSAVSQDLFSNKPSPAKAHLSAQSKNADTGQSYIRVSLPVVGDVHLPTKFIKPGLVGLVLFVVVLVFLGSR
ncbi:MAG: hypothetical protein FD167_586 [bacterium]|nr:MAG: hypothetical protein FD167_586 [bacterium]